MRLVMVMSVASLRAMTDEQIIALHDEKWNVSESGTFYLDELRRREAARAETASYTLAKRVYVLTWVNSALAALAAFGALLALFMR